jgi:RNA polymerase sigma factor (sigma-70 family)
MAATQDKSDQIKFEKQLIAGCVAKDKQSWDLFVDTYGKLVYKIIYRTLASKGFIDKNSLAEELYNEVFVAFLSKDSYRLKSFKWKNGSSLATWIRVITRNLVLDYIRKISNETEILQSANEKVFDDDKKELIDTLTDDRSDSALDLLESDDNRIVLEKAFKELSDTDKQLLELLYFQNFSHEDTAAVLNKTVDAIYMQKNRLIQKIKGIIEKVC